MPEEPIERLIDRLLNESPHSRRRFVGRAGAAGLAASSLGAFLAACGGVEGTAEKTAAAPKTANHPKTKITQLDFSNWTLYVDKSVLKDFERETGGKVRYVEDVNDNEEFFGKVRQPLQQNRSIDRDIIVLTDWIVPRFIRLGYLEPLDKRNIPNFKNLQDNLTSPTFDPKRTYSLPWQSGMTSIGYNPKKTGGKLTSIKEIFDPKFKGRVSLFGDARDSSNLLMLMDGIDPDTAKIDDVLAAIEKIDEQNRKGQIRRFTGNDYTTDLTKGNVWIAMAYSGDVGQLKKDNPDLEFLIPEEGATLFTDNMLIPEKAAHPYAAEAMMNYVYEPEVAAKIAIEVGYISPVKGVREILERSEPELAEDPLLFPDDATRAKLSSYPVLNAEEERRMNEAMQAVVGA